MGYLYLYAVIMCTQISVWCLDNHHTFSGYVWAAIGGVFCAPLIAAYNRDLKRRKG